MAVSLQIFELDPGLDVLQATRAFSGERLLVLLDSAARHRERDARYSVLTADPIADCRLNAVTIHQPVFEQLRQWQRDMSLSPETDTDGLPPFFGGIAGLLSYEFGHAFERLPQPAIDEFRSPAMLAGLFDWAIVWDHLAKTVRCYVLKFSAGSGAGAASDEEKPQGNDRLEWILSRLQADPPTQAIHSSEPQTSAMLFAEQHRIEPSTPIYSSFTRDGYLKAVSRVIEYIRAGDIFQANLSQRLLAEWSSSAVDLYGRVRQNNPAPFCGLFQADDFAVVSASPERFLKVDRNHLVETRPIKGTRRRPRSPIADLFAGDELSASEKDRAENVMIVDLLRNDISRNCRTGSVKVTGLCEIERFETVLHLVSTIQGILGESRDVWDLLGGCFPGGSITGAPKIRAMEIIAELEPTVRGAYCGSLFALGPAGDFDSSILIRTFTLKNGWVQFPVGGGIVADSDPLDEYRETLHKASGLIRTLGQ